MTNQTAIETKEFQQVEQIAIHQADRCEERMKVATISEQTRNYLTLLGRIIDIDTSAYECVEKEYGDRQTEYLLKDFSMYLSNARSEIGKILNWSIVYNIGQIGCKEV